MRLFHIKTAYSKPIKKNSSNVFDSQTFSIRFGLPHYFHKFTLGLIFLLFTIANRSNAAWISEIQPEHRPLSIPTATNPVIVPPSIEISGFSAGVAAELVIIDASNKPTRRGTILQVIPLIHGPSTRLIAGDAWPTSLFPFADLFSGLITQPAGDNPLALSGSRTLVLFDGPTGMIAHSGTIGDNINEVTDAIVLDMVTFGDTAETSVFHEELLLEINPGDAIIRPMKSIAEPWDDLYLIGKPGNDGFILDISPIISLTPGMPNPIWPSATIPEPSTLAITLVATILFLKSRRFFHQELFLS